VKIELRKIKIAKFASEETLCFEAEVWIDGEKCGTTGNAGHGGGNRYQPHTLGEKLEAHARTLPDLQSEYGPLKMNADLLVSELVDDHLEKKDLERLLKRRIVFESRHKPNLWEAKKTGAAGEVEAFAKRPDVARVLNLLPFEEALRLYREKAKRREG
jgi:hypothetical protein